MVQWFRRRCLLKLKVNNGRWRTENDQNRSPLAFCLGDLKIDTLIQTLDRNTCCFLRQYVFWFWHSWRHCGTIKLRFFFYFVMQFEQKGYLHKLHSGQGQFRLFQKFDLELRSIILYSYRIIKYLKGCKMATCWACQINMLSAILSRNLIILTFTILLVLHPIIKVDNYDMLLFENAFMTLDI